MNRFTRRACLADTPIPRLRPETKQHLHFGVNFVVAPAAAIAPAQQLQFQQGLADPVHGIVFDVVQKAGPGIVFQRAKEPLQVHLGPVGPQVGQLLITAGKPARTLDDFISDAESVISVYRSVWPGSLQILRRDVTIRHLYAIQGQEQHAFQYLWERRLHQGAAAMASFGRPVVGGGLRVVLPPRANVEDDTNVEVKIESLLSDPRQLFVEASFVWPSPRVNAEPEPGPLLNVVEQFLDTEVRNFILSEQ